MENDNPLHIDNFPNEVLQEILQHLVTSTPDSLAEALQVKPLLQTSQRWRAIALLFLPKAPFTIVYPPWEMGITGSWTDREHQKDEAKLPKLLLYIHRYEPPRLTVDQILAMTVADFQRLESECSGPPPFQIAFEVAEDLEVHFGPSLRDFRPLHDTPAHPPLKSLVMKGTINGGTLFMDLHTMTFPHLGRLFIDECLSYPEEFDNILHRMPSLEECRISLHDHGSTDTPCDYRFEAPSLVSLSISFRSYSRNRSWQATACMPKLETLICRAVHPFQKALTFVSPSLRTIVTFMDGTCADRQAHLMTLLEKCPRLEKLVIPTELLLMSSFFIRLSSGAIVPNLKVLQCGPFMLSADSLVGLLRKKGFVDAPASKSEEELPTLFSGLLLGSQKEIEERLEGVTGVVEFVGHQIGRKLGDSAFGI
ncbi:hypothetical protein BDN72DRAFT_840981 [Pluteus cervinus]|uniref:Uncharacterized protein n=1 Tax=Pluteus cervinus TaxID=181527 RepID=A0ACD3ATS0_9AGAR|nr:hypothetical protein BDN72DRAFT_840981 [Pluteus cervinus]